MSEFFSLVQQLKSDIDALNAILLGGDSDTVTIDGEVKPSISKAIADSFTLIESMVQNRLPYETKAAMDAAGAPGTNVLAEVWNDPTTDGNGILINNGLYGWSGSAWVKSAYTSDSATNLAAARKAQAGLLDKENLVQLPVGSGYAWAVLDADKNILVGVTENGELVADMPGQAISVPADGETDYVWALASEDGEIFLYVDKDGHLGFSAKDGVRSAPYVDDQIEFAWADETGRPLLAFDQNGGAWSPGVQAQPLPYVAGGELRVIGTGDELVAKLGSTEMHNLRPLNGRTVQGVWNRPSLHNVQRVSGAAGAGYLVPDDFNTLHVVVVYGQSLSVGSQGQPIISTRSPFPGDVLMFDGDSTVDIRMGLQTQGTPDALDPETLTGFQDLVAKNGQGSGTRGETVGEALGYGLARAARGSGARWHGMFFAPGYGGTSYNGLKKGTTPYSNMLAGLVRCKELAEAEGWRVVVDAVVMIHGESDAGNSGYLGDLLEWQTDIDTDFKAITGQVADVPFLMNQPSSMFASFDGALGLYEAHKQSPHHFLIGPNYDLPYSDDLLHLSSVGYHLLGEKATLACIKMLWTGESWEPVRPLSVTRSSNQVDIVFAVPVGPLAIDTTTVSDPGQWGFEYADDGGATAITNAEIIADNTLRLTLATVPSGANPKLRYGLSGHTGERYEETIPRGNLRDSCARSSNYDGRHLYNWCVHFEEDVT